jgi:hypothetical protein
MKITLTQEEINKIIKEHIETSLGFEVIDIVTYEPYCLEVSYE